MSQDERPLYGELVIPFNAENKREMHSETMTRAEQLRAMIKVAAYFLAEKRGFVFGHELEDWLKAEMEILRNLK
jgi:hypothetical protein